MKRNEIYYVNLDPTVGHEIKKTRPCIIISPDEMNDNLHTVTIISITSVKRDIPTRIYLNKKHSGLTEQDNWAVLDQIRTVDKKRLGRKIGSIYSKDAEEISYKLIEMFTLP